jgi:hypothetical protein
MVTAVNGKGEERAIDVRTVGDQKVITVKKPGGAVATRLTMTLDAAEDLAAELEV